MKKSAQFAEQYLVWFKDAQEEDWPAEEARQDAAAAEGDREARGGPAAPQHRGEAVQLHHGVRQVHQEAEEQSLLLLLPKCQ